MKYNNTIEAKIMIPFLLIVLLPCLAVGVASYWTGFQSYKIERFKEAEYQLKSVLSYTNVIEQRSQKKELNESTAKELVKHIVLQSKSIILLENSGTYRDLEPFNIDGETPWWASYLKNEDGKYKRLVATKKFEEEWVMIHHVQKWDWTIIIPFSFSYFEKPLIDIQKNTLLVMIVASIMAVQITILLSHHLSRPLKNLVMFCQNLGKVDTTDEIEVSLSRNDEIGILANAIKEMLDNIEEKKQLEKRMERIERLASMGQMAAGIAHEIRNPLAGIKTTIQVLAQRLQLEDKNQRLFEGIAGEIERVNRIISNLLNLARPRDPNPSQILVKEVVDQLLVLLEKENKGKRILFNNYIKEDLSYSADSDHFKQIIINLSLNAVNAMSSGGRIDFCSSKDGKLMIKDEGNGIGKDLLDKIFNPFYTTSSSGTGLGLSMVHQLVLQNNGEIEIESEQGKGTTFILQFPILEKE